MWDFGVIIRLRPLEGDMQDRRSLYYIPSVRLSNATTTRFISQGYERRKRAAGIILFLVDRSYRRNLVGKSVRNRARGS